VVEKNRIESLEQSVLQLRDNLEGLETREREKCLSDGYEGVEHSDTVD